MVIEGELDKAGHKPSKEERRATTARQKVIDTYLGDESGASGTAPKKFADPMSMF